MKLELHSNIDVMECRPLNTQKLLEVKIFFAERGESFSTSYAPISDTAFVKPMRTLHSPTEKNRFRAT